LRMRQAHPIHKDHRDGSKIVDIWRSLLIRHALTKFATMMVVLESTLPVSATATTLMLYERMITTLVDGLGSIHAMVQ
jgi:hypothetical protein